MHVDYIIVLCILDGVPILSADTESGLYSVADDIEGKFSFLLCLKVN